MSTWWEIVEKFNPGNFGCSDSAERVLVPIPAESEPAQYSRLYPAPAPKTFPHFQHQDGTSPGALQQPRAEFDPLWGDPCSCGSRDWQRKGCSANLECLRCGGVVHSEYLATGGKR